MMNVKGAKSKFALHSYRVPLAVNTMRCLRSTRGLARYPVCPRCCCTLDREYQAFCDRCGQALSWDDYDKALIILPG